MSIESEAFSRKTVIWEKLIPFGFSLEKGIYSYSEKLMNGEFRADIRINERGFVYGTVMDNELEEEYINFRLPNALNRYAAQVREEYEALLRRIADECFRDEPFLFPQSNRLCSYIRNKCSVAPEFLWNLWPGYGVFRNPGSKKWFGIIINIDKGKLISGEAGEVEIINLKLDELAEEYVDNISVLPPYHQTKKNWVSVILDDSLDDDTLEKMIDISFGKSAVSSQWLVPANPKYYDVMNAFNDTDTILWKQSSKILPGDIVYLYVAEPYSAIMFRCKVVESDIPYEFHGENVSMHKVMRIRLLRRYDKDEFPLRKLNEYGIKA
ncbi:MAG: MmcQ/YjbR family DNA-binding protein, partial [Erysipelotrichaceae bacterium]|nr:MmcQ/YjbR family DNA-binding protein [Erysipelotrichaceae bacterium]